MTHVTLDVTVSLSSPSGKHSYLCTAPVADILWPLSTEPNKDLLLDFLNELLKEEQGEIKELTYLKNEHLSTSEIYRKAIFDGTGHPAVLRNN